MHFIEDMGYNNIVIVVVNHAYRSGTKTDFIDSIANAIII